MDQVAPDRRSFETVFKDATRHEPYPYQSRVAKGDALPDLIEAPTGMGKTECAVLAWVWRRRYADQTIRDSTSRRLVYCLPMRALVEQTQTKVTLWLERLGLLETSPTPGPGIRVVKVLGGEVWKDWDTNVEEDQIIIGTQDMLLSRALNRGYAMSRYRWPLHFGLLNNDCTWVIDEPQLMGVGLHTTAQLCWLRKALGTYGPTHTLWMSATIKPDWLRTIDFPAGSVLKAAGLDATDESSEAVAKRLHARKHLAPARAPMDDPKGLAAEITEFHDGHLTLVVVNTVRRAKELYKALASKKGPEVVLLHSQFRPGDKEALMRRVEDLAKLRTEGGKGAIVVSTQVIEAGVDLSAGRMVTELAPWSSLVQRFGRCNRYGEHPVGEIKVVLPPEGKMERFAEPYSPEQLEHSLELLAAMPGDFDSATLSKEFDHPEQLDVLRRTDLLELFDTTADLFGKFTDVSRFVRAAEDVSVQVFWRDLKESGPATQPMPLKRELCPAPLYEVRDMMKRAGAPRFFTIDPTLGEWVPARANEVVPGMVLMLDAAEGMYTSSLGWDKGSKARVIPLLDRAAEQEVEPPDSYSWDRPGREERTIEEHSMDVLGVARRVITNLPIPERTKAEALEAALWHDAGKAHAVFQHMLGNGEGKVLLAKARSMLTGKAREEALREGKVRPFFRHELVSGLMCLELGKGFLTSYLTAAHHGKVRVSIRSVPTERGPPDGERFARGVWENDEVPIPLEVPEGKPRTFRVDLSVMEMGERDGRPSWTRQVLELRGSPEMGPFRLAMLEGLIKSADERASGGER